MLSNLSGPILAVDDDETQLAIVASIFEDLGADVVRCTSGLDCERLFSDKKPALVMLDIMLPDIDGIELCKKFRQLDKTTPILMVSSLDEQVDIDHAIAAGANDYVLKPINRQNLIEKVSTLLS